MPGAAGILSAFGLSASAGLNAYIPLLIVAIMARLDVISLNEPWDALESWWAIGALVVLVLIEFFVDKIPAVDTVNDVIQTFIRPAAGAILFAASANAVTDLSPVVSLILGLLIAGGVHVGKSTVRPMITATTAGIGNPIVSTAEDITSTVLALLAVVLPWLVLLVAVTGIVIFLAWRLRRARARHP
jgi:hypothetical protein